MGDGVMANGYGGDHLDFGGAKFTGPFTAKAEYRERAAAPTALDALPARAVGFAGRGGELGELLDAFDPSVAAGGPEAVVVAAVSGLGGIGKTALAIEAGYAARGKGWFPGGVLFVDLHGYDEEPVTAEQALEALLRALGTEPEHIPGGVDARAGLFRSVLAARARERGAVLILADNASSSAQVRPLLPGGGAGHRLLVTSRGRLPQLGGRLLALGELLPGEAYELLDLALRTARPADSRVTDDSEQAARLAALCGHLPLALQIAAAQLVVDSDKPVAELAAELAASRDLLGHLDDGERNVRAAFDLSYQRLPAEQARLLRLLALAPGPDVADEVVAVLVGVDDTPIQDLEALVRVHLVERGRESGRRRWRLHDLVRAFGVGVVTGDAGWMKEGEEARGRVLRFYWRWAGAADDRLRWLPGRSVPARFVDRGQALAWLDGERASLVAAVQWANEEAHRQRAVALAGCLGSYLEWRRYFDDWATVARVALEAAHHAGDRFAEACAWNDLGFALREVGRAEEALDALRHALDLHRANADREGEATAWNNFGNALLTAGRAEEAIVAHIRARDLYREVGDRVREADTWNNLGSSLDEVGRLEEAIVAHTRARDLCQVAGGRHSEASAWHNLGLALRHAGRIEHAVEAYGRALGIFREFEDWYRAGQTLFNLALAHAATHRLLDARICYLQAAASFGRANAPDGVAAAQAAASKLLTP
ncbi:tetratricopeptide repeat protein [Streptomyces sp. NPDC046909]|uniref:tetratricopeptide repeat protein n=1 Tax=Streptomyces sp. NPDC046909 TaxID=3155617 RepID=UPI0033CDB712